MVSPLAGSEIVIAPTPTAHFGAGAVGKLPGIARGLGSQAVVVVTDAALAATPVVARVTGEVEAAGMPVTVFSGVHPNPTTGDLAAGADAVAAGRPGGSRMVLVAVGGGSPIDAAKGIALAAVNPQRGRDLDYRGEFARPALPIVAVPTTAGTGAETNAFGVVTDPQTRRKFYVGHASSLPAAAILDPDLTVGLPPLATAATGMDALTHALESYLSIRANPWSDGIALQVIRMIAVHLPRAHADGHDLEARSQMLLAAHMAGIGMATTGLGLCHAIGHSLGGRFDIAHGVALTMLLPHVLRFNAEVCGDRLADVAFALGVGDTGRGSGWNADAAVEAIAGLAHRLGMTQRIADLGITGTAFDQIAADALDDEVLANTPRPPAAADIHSILLAARQ
ncbi:MAG TPA: iron-containing alcohol dehydrogenase [Streptosporangiaceae bacterium]|jgi:alcohol dehydrogenase|nr:iron-containing alcohol dehydrogenase [Streptosporangiaceae bacterium]